MKIIRIPNLLIIILTQGLLRFCIIDTYMGFSASEPALSFFNFMLLIFSTVLIAAGGYVINDYFDINIDEKNKPGKLIVGKLINKKNTLIYYWILTLMGVGIGFYLSIVVNYYLLGFIFPAVAIMLWFYSSKHQKQVLTGNLMIACLSALVILILWLFEFFALKADPISFVNVISQINTIHIIVLMYTLFAFFVTFVREIVKDIEDMKGDEAGDYKTLAVVKGATYAKNIAIVIHIFIMLILVYVQYLLFNFDLMLLFWYVTIAVQLLFVYVLYFLLIAKTKKEYNFLSNAYKLLMVAGILSMQLFYISF